MGLSSGQRTGARERGGVRRRHKCDGRDGWKRGVGTGERRTCINGGFNEERENRVGDFLWRLWCCL
jgi:hypothetical protein